MAVILELMIKYITKYGTLLWICGMLAFVSVLWTFYWFNIIGYSLGVTGLFSLILLVLYLVYSKFNQKSLKNPSLSPDMDNNLSHRVSKGVKIIYLIGIILLLLILQNTSIRPISYFIISSIVVGTIVFSIIKSIDSIYVSIIKIIGYYLLQSLAIFKYYYWVGNDTWWHAIANEILADVGYLYNSLDKEIDYPIQHIACAIADILAGVDIRFASIIAITIPLILISPVVFLISRHIIGNKGGLIALLLFTLFPPMFEWVIMAQTTSYGVLISLLLLIVYFLWADSRFKKMNVICLFVFFGLIIILGLTHQFSAFLFLFVMFGIYIGNAFNVRHFMNSNLGLLVISCVIVCVQYLIASFGLDESISIIIRGFESVSDSINLDISSAYNEIYQPNILQNLINSPFMYIFIGLVFSGVLFIQNISPKTKSEKITLTISSITIIMSIAWMFCFLLKASMSHRLYPILGFCYAIIFSCIIYDISYKLTRKNILIMLTISLIALISLSSVSISPDNPIFVKNTTSDVNEAITCEEYVGLSTFMPYVYTLIDDNQILVDNNIKRATISAYYRQHYNISQTIPYIGANVYAFNVELTNVQSNQYLVFRTSILDRFIINTVRYGNNNYYMHTIKVNQSLALKLDKYNKLYDNQELTWYNGMK